MIQRLVEDAKSRYTFFVDWLRKKVFGVNNEKLDFVVDSFSSLDQKQKQWVIFGAIGLGVFLTALVFGIYFSRLNALDRDLDRAMAALVDLRRMKTLYHEYDNQFFGIVKAVEDASQSVRMKPFFEEKAKTIGINMQGLQDQAEDLPSEDLLSTKLRYQRVDMRLPETSIPRLLNFILEIERAGHFIFLEDLQIRGRFGTKLFFDMSARFRGYVPK
jgi:hypothetical protein